jgi:hypothetical protein
MADIRRSISINASPEDVFRFVASAWESDLAFWEVGVEGWKPLTPPPLAEGFQVEYTARMLGIPNKVRMEVREYSEGVGWWASSIKGPPVRGDWQFEREGRGTRFTYRLRYAMPPPLLGPLLDKMILAALWEKAAGHALLKLRVMVEGRISFPRL